MKRSRLKTGHKKKIFEIYVCNCGYAIEVARLHETLKEFGHKKYMYCPKCKRVKNFVNRGKATEKKIFKFLIDR